MLTLPIITHEYIMIGQGEFEITNLSIAEVIINAMKANPNYCLVEAETGNSITNDVLLKNIAALSEELSGRGIKQNDVIGICSENRLEYVVPVIAALSLGATVATLNPLYTTDELKHVLSISRPQVMFCSPFTAGKVKEVQSHLPFMKEIIFFDDGSSCKGFTQYTEIIKRKFDVNLLHCLKIDPTETVAVILCSSGTTGLPKCVELTHSNLMCFINAARNPVLNSGTESASLGLIPFFHGYGFGVLLFSIALNMKLIIMSKFDEKVFLSTIEKYRISTLCLVPPLILFLAKSPLVSKYDLSSITRIVCGAAPLSRSVQYAAQKRLKLSNNIDQGYGMTESSVSVTLMPPDKSKIGSVGVVVPGMQCKVIDIETRKALPPFKEGELCFKGPFVMKGYRNNAVATAEAIDLDGWLHTGDVGYYDEEGFIYIVDRLKELIKYKGFQVAPAELEALLLTNPLVKDAAVVGIPNEEAGELPMAFIVKQPGAQVSEDEIKKFVAGKVSPQKRLHLVRFVDEIPKNPSGKILRRELRNVIKKSKL